jgi:hypothetical protein
MVVIVFLHVSVMRLRISIILRFILSSAGWILATPLFFFQRYESPLLPNCEMS